MQNSLRRRWPVAEADFRLASTAAARAAFISEWQSRTAQELVKVSREQDALGEQFKKLQRRSSLVNLKAPADGIILEIAQTSAGAVIEAAKPLLKIVPVDVPLVAEVDIQPKDVGKIKLGDGGRLKLESLPFQKHGVIHGAVNYISEDTFDKAAGAGVVQVYRAQVSIGKSDLRQVPPTFRLMPGMTLTADVKVGKRRLITYFIYPMIRSIETSFREP